MTMVLLCALSESDEAQAQSITFSSQSVRMRRAVERKSDEDPQSINRKDCIDDDPTDVDYDVVEKTGLRTWLQMTVNLENIGNNKNIRIEVWASQGADCTDNQQRSTTGSCHLAARVKNVSTAGKTATAIVRPRVVISKKSIDDVTVTDPANYPDVDICNSELDAAYSFYVILFNGDTILDSLLWTDTRIDLEAPAPPEDFSAFPGDNNIFLEWTIPSTEEQTDSDGFVYYCVPAGTVVAAAAGGAGGAGGGSGSSDCTQNVLVAGSFPPIDDTYRCGSSRGRTARKGQASDVTNGETYAVAISSLDIRANPGLLSTVECVTPQEVTTFWERYQAAGGRGGGGVCSIRSGISSSWMLSLFFITGLLVLLRRARTKQHRRLQSSAGDLHT